MEAHVVAHQMAEQVDVFGAEVQTAQDLAGDLGAHAVVLVESPLAVEVFAGEELAHIVEEHGHGAQPVVVEAFFGVVAHALQGVVEDRLLGVVIIVAALADAGQGGHFGDEALEDMGVEHELHEAVHGFGGHFAPFVHDVGGGHVVQHAGGRTHDGQPGVGLDGDVEVGGEAQGADGQQIVVAQGLVRQAGELDEAALDVHETVIDVPGGGRAAEAGHAQLQALLGIHHVGHGGGDAQQGKLGMAGILHFQGIETEKNAVFFHLGDGTLVRLDAGFGEELEKRLEVGLTGDVHSQLFAVFQKMFLHGRIDDMGVIAVAQQGFADGDGVF